MLELSGGCAGSKAVKSSNKKSRRDWFALALGAAAFSAFALNDVIVAGRSFTCQNTCVVGVTSGGGWYVYDSHGGWLRENHNDPNPRIN